MLPRPRLPTPGRAASLPLPTPFHLFLHIPSFPLSCFFIPPLFRLVSFQALFVSLCFYLKFSSFLALSLSISFFPSPHYNLLSPSPPLPAPLQPLPLMQHAIIARYFTPSSSLLFSLGVSWFIHVFFLFSCVHAFGQRILLFWLLTFLLCFLILFLFVFLFNALAFAALPLSEIFLKFLCQFYLFIYLFKWRLLNWLFKRCYYYQWFFFYWLLCNKHNTSSKIDSSYHAILITIKHSMVTITKLLFLPPRLPPHSVTRGLGHDRFPADRQAAHGEWRWS